MMIRFCIFALIFTTRAFASADSTTWDQLSRLLEVKKGSKVFEQFSRELELRETPISEGLYANTSGMMVSCVGDDIIKVGVRVSKSTLKLPFHLKAKDDLFSAARKLSFTLTEDQKGKSNENLEMMDLKHSLVIVFLNGRVFEVWKQRANHTAEPGSPSRAGSP